MYHQNIVTGVALEGGVFDITGVGVLLVFEKTAACVNIG
jgi:hypothetical protein